MKEETKLRQENGLFKSPGKIWEEINAAVESWKSNPTIK